MIAGLVIIGAILAGFGVIAFFTYLAERWEWRDRSYYIDEPPFEDERSSITRHRRELDTRDAQ